VNEYLITYTDNGNPGTKIGFGDNEQEAIDAFNTFYPNYKFISIKQI